MAVVLYRVDERLVHGQVVIGWGRVLRPDEYVVVDDDLAESEWEQELYRLGAEEYEMRFLTAAEAGDTLADLEAEEARIVLLTRDVDHMARLAQEGRLQGREVNLGGIHHRDGRTEVRSYIHLDDEDREAIRALVDAGAEVSGRDLPETLRVPADALLR